MTSTQLYFVQRGELVISNVSTGPVEFATLKQPNLVVEDENGVFKRIQPGVTKLTLVDDTEFATILKMLRVLSVQAFCPELFANEVLVWCDVENDTEFHIVFDTLKAAGVTVEEVLEDELMENLLPALDDLQQGISHTLSARKRNDALRVLRQSPEVLKVMSQFGLDATSVDILDGALALEMPRLQVELTGFFHEADLFKLFGVNHQASVYGLKLETTRVIKETAGNAVMSKEGAHLCYAKLNGELTDIRLRLRETKHRLPPSSGGGLANQAKVFGCENLKLDIETPEVAAKLGLKDVRDIKANMHRLYDIDKELFIRYAAQDVFTTHELSLKQLELLNKGRTLLGLNPLDDVKDTAGSNVMATFRDAAAAHFEATSGDNAKVLKGAFKSSDSKKLQADKSNKWGHQTYDTVGGLLFSRTPRHSHITGNLGDLDESSCYATALTSMNIYIGMPQVRSYKRQQDKPTLASVVAEMSVKCPRDGWFVRVSGKLSQAVNTLVLSNLEFSPKKEFFKDVDDKLAARPNQKVLGGINANKVGKSEASSKLLTKEVKFGVITAETWDVLKLLPESHLAEFAALTVDAVVFVEHRFIATTIAEKLALEADLPTYDDSIKTVVKDDHQMDIYLASKSHVCLSFPAGEFYTKVKNERKRAKKAGESVQELFKLLLNATYGGLACPWLSGNNKLAANIITASARATSWMMMYMTNGFQVITDGCQFSWDNMPLGETFRELVERNPDYLLHYDPTVKSGLTTKDFKKVLKQQQAENSLNGISSDNLNTRQVWVDRCFQNAMSRFYQTTPEECRPLSRFAFELKTERYNRNSLTEFQEFFNTGAGNYIKVLHGLQHLQKYQHLEVSYDINGTDYRADERVPEVRVMKARAYRTNGDVSTWYKDMLTDANTASIVLPETALLSLSEASQEATDELVQAGGTVVVPLGFEKKTPKLMKLVTHSQFLFQTEKQYDTFIKFEEECIRKQTSILMDKSFWHSLTGEELAAMGLENLKLDASEMVRWVKSHSVGFGLELLTWNSRFLKTINDLRVKVSELVDAGCTKFEDKLRMSSVVPKLSRERVLVLAELTIKRWLAKQELRETMRNSTRQATLMQATRDNLTTLEEELGAVSGANDDWE